MTESKPERKLAAIPMADTADWAVSPGVDSRLETDR